MSKPEQSHMIDPNEVKLYFKNILPPDLEKIRKSKQMFTDPYFPPNDLSIDSKKMVNGKETYVDEEEGPDNQEWMEEQNDYPKKNREWARTEDIIPGKWEIFEGKIELEDIKQGNIGNCYFISAVAALVEFPELLKQNFPTQKYADIGYYEVVLYIDGEWQRVFVDNFFPVEKGYKTKKYYAKKPQNSFYFSTPNGKELWSILLEKAWAKVNGGYSNTEGGQPYEVLLAFTGYPSQILDNNAEGALKTFRIIEKADQEDAIMGCASYASDGCTDKDENENGICFGHAYTLIAAKSKKDDLGEINLYKIRNPWGSGEWKGRYKDSDPAWQSKELCEFFGQTGKNDGMFFIDSEDYPENYETTQICRIIKDAKFRRYLIKNEDQFKGAAVYNLYMPEKGSAILSVVEKSRRFSREMPYRTYAFFSLLIFQYDENYNITKFIGGKSTDSVLGMNVDLDKGYYACIVYFPFEHENLGPNFSYAFTIFSSVQFTCKFTGKDSKLQCLEKLIIEYFKFSHKFEIETTQQKINAYIKEILDATNLIPRIFYNKTSRIMKININFDKDKKKNDNFASIGHFDDKYWKKPIEILLEPNKFGLYLGSNTNFSRKFHPEFKLSLTSTKEEPSKFEDYQLSNLLKFNLDDDTNIATKEKSMSQDITAKIMNQSKVRDTLDNPQFRDAKKITNPVNKFSTYENLKKEFPNEFYILDKATKDHLGNVGLKWIKYQSSGGLYVGQLNSNKRTEGRGIFFFKNGQTFIGNYKNGEAVDFGLIFGKDKNLIYKGEISKGIANGYGVMFDKNNSWIGNFKDGKIHGFGIGTMDYKGHKYEWIGNYKNGKENGVGLLKCFDPKSFCLSKFEMGKSVKHIGLSIKECSELKKGRDEVYNIIEQYGMGNSSLEEQEKVKEKFLKLLNDYYNYKEDPKKNPKPKV